ncbi:thioredoxin family protein [Halopiger xanaduensis]|uniref:Thioredoxin domain-containing protein n=1 Tax=Halopiger xanaduensis (strain DSM 18323 / JCM 14033 / SH-6) TaxID=797210 RepID=F8D4V7_HALXS|nr:thioredoxin family protein [Halopiger xanaduensis]AEH37584.1 Thioredoxin domain-containing protein [Halopiger xanaduensis SH-6]
MSDATPKPTQLADGAELESFVDRYDVALVEFYTVGCPKCQAMEPVLGNVARSTAVPIGMLNPGDDLGLVDRFDIESVPSLLLFRDGEPVARLADGFVGGDELVDFLAEHAPGAVDADA